LFFVTPCIINSFLKSLIQETEVIPKIFAALKVLEKYASNLLKDENERHHQWDKINFTSKAFNYVRPLVSNRDILRNIGYTVDITSERGELGGVAFEEGTKPDIPKVEEHTLDLCIAKHEVREITHRTHPRMKSLKDVDVLPTSFFVVSDTMGSSDSKQPLELILTSTTQTINRHIETTPISSSQSRVIMAYGDDDDDDDDEKPPESTIKGLYSSNSRHLKIK